MKSPIELGLCFDCSDLTQSSMSLPVPWPVVHVPDIWASEASTAKRKANTSAIIYHSPPSFLELGLVYQQWHWKCKPQLDVLARTIDHWD